MVELSAAQRALYDRCVRRWAEHPGKQQGGALAFFHALLVQFKVDAAVAATRGALAPRARF